MQLNESGVGVIFVVSLMASSSDRRPEQARSHKELWSAEDLCFST
jgi:hypothetical protein